MLRNQKLLKYISHLGDYDPLKDALPHIDPTKVKDENFVLTKFNEKILVENKILLFFNPLRGRFMSKGAISDDMYTLDIIVPYNYWIIKDTNELRAYSMAYEVCQSIDQQRIAGVGDVEVVDWDSFKVNNKYSGLTLLVKVTNPSLVEG